MMNPLAPHIPDSELFFWKTAEGSLRSGTVAPKRTKLMSRAEYDKALAKREGEALDMMAGASQLAAETRLERATVIASRTGMSVEAAAELLA